MKMGLGALLKDARASRVDAVLYLSLIHIYDAVAYRVIPLGEVHIRGYGLPDYAAMTENTP